MLEQIERNPRVFIQGHNLTVQKGAGRERFAGTRNILELFCKKVFSSRPERHSAGISTSKTAVAVKFNLVEPFLALGKFLKRQGIHRFNEPDFGGRQRAEVFGSHEEWRQ